ncbi:hypothetical protein [Caulobacter sp.]|uniref:hypothetical protein n=1 Tax=Caulobacter sp. TaxID=78 RepID=UPI00161A6BDD
MQAVLQRRRARKKAKRAKKAASTKKLKAVTIKSSTEVEARKSNVRLAEARLATLNAEYAALQEQIAPLTVRSVKKAGLLLLPDENVVALRKLRPIEADLKHKITEATAALKTARRLLGEQ